MEQRKISALGVISRLAPSLDKVEGIKLYMQPVQDLTVDDRVSRTQYQYTLEDPNQAELNTVVHDFVAKLKQLPQLADVVTDQQLGGVAEMLMIDRLTASRFVASRPRPSTTPSHRRFRTAAQINTRFTRSSAISTTWCWRQIRSSRGIRRSFTISIFNLP